MVKDKNIKNIHLPTSINTIKHSLNEAINHIGSGKSFDIAIKKRPKAKKSHPLTYGEDAI